MKSLSVDLKGALSLARDDVKKHKEQGTLVKMSDSVSEKTVNLKTIAVFRAQCTLDKTAFDVIFNKLKEENKDFC